MFIYMLVRKTWSSHDNIRPYLDKAAAQKEAARREVADPCKDGWDKYYVETYEVDNATIKEKLYIVYEDNHGDISYWTSKRLAIREVKRVIYNGWCKQEIRQIIKEDIRDNPESAKMKWWEHFSDYAGFHAVPLNVSWL